MDNIGGRDAGYSTVRMGAYIAIVSKSLQKDVTGPGVGSAQAVRLTNPPCVAPIIPAARKLIKELPVTGTADSSSGHRVISVIQVFVSFIPTPVF